MHLGGGAPQWRMATLFVQWLPRAAQLRVVALGEAARAELPWTARCLAAQHALPTPQFSDVRTFGDMLVSASGSSGNWGIAFVTPWIVAKQARGKPVDPDEGALRWELCKAISSRAQKFTALCADEPMWQRLGGHIARYVAEALLPAAIRVEGMHIKSLVLPLASKGNRGSFNAYAWMGDATLRVTESLLPWISLLAICGGGENADKGFGAVELMPERECISTDRGGYDGLAVVDFGRRQ